MRFTRILTMFAAACAFASTALAGTALTPHKAEYKVKISVVSGQLNTELRKTEDGYVANHVIRPVGMSKLITRGTMDVTSEFSSQPDGVKPVTFRAVDTIRKDPEVNLSFDWSTNQASGTVGEENVTLQLDGISHDSVSIQYELMHDLMNGGPSEQYVLFDIDKMRVANVTNAGTKTVKDQSRQIRSCWHSASEGRFIEGHDDVVCRRAGLPARRHRAASQGQIEFQGDARQLYADRRLNQANRIESCSTSRIAAVISPAASRLAPHFAIVSRCATPANSGNAGSATRQAIG